MRRDSLWHRRGKWRPRPLGLIFLPEIDALDDPIESQRSERSLHLKKGGWPELNCSKRKHLSARLDRPDNTSNRCALRPQGSHPRTDQADRKYQFRHDLLPFGILLRSNRTEHQRSTKVSSLHQHRQGDGSPASRKLPLPLDESEAHLGPRRFWSPAMLPK